MKDNTREVVLFIIGLLLIILGFLSFAAIGIINRYFDTTLIQHFSVVGLGLILILLGIIVFIFFLKDDKTKNLQYKNKVK